METRHHGHLAIFLFVIMLIVGCAGSGGGTSTTGTTGNTTGTSGTTGTTGTTGSSAFAGQWAGTFQDQIPVNGGGPISMAISGTGAFTVEAENTKLHTQITGSGTIDSSGNVTGTVTNGSGTNANVTGQLQLGAGNSLGGFVIVANGTGSSQLNVTMSR